MKHEPTDKTDTNTIAEEEKDSHNQTIVEQKEESADISIGTEIDIDDRRFIVDSVDNGYVSLQDITFQNAAGFPIFRRESVDFVRSIIEQQWESEPKPETLPAPKVERNRDVYDIHPEVPMSERIDFKIENDTLGRGTMSEKYAANVEAIRTLKQINSEERFATPEEQEIPISVCRMGRSCRLL